MRLFGMGLLRLTDCSLREIHMSRLMGKLTICIRPDFFYFLVLGSADPIFSKTGIKMKLLSLNFIFFIAADRNFPPHSEIKYRTFFVGELCAGTPSRQ